MLSPKHKVSKSPQGRIHGMAKGGTQLNFGAYGLKAVTPERVTARRPAARRAITRHLRRAGRVWIRIFLMCLSHQSRLRSRMGKGKGSQDIGWHR